MPKTKSDTPTLFVYNQSDDPHVGAPVRINGRNYIAHGSGAVDLSGVIGQRIEDLMVNGVRIPLSTKPIIERNSRFHAHVKSRTLELLASIIP